MNAPSDAEWPDDFSHEEMLEQQSRLLIEECHMLQRDLSRYRRNMAALIDLHASAIQERDQLRTEISHMKAHLSDCLRENSALGNRVTGLESCRVQLEAMHQAQRSVNAK